MRLAPLLMAALISLPLAASQALADAPAATTAAPQAMLSNPPVTPDPTYTDATYASKWPHITLQEAQRLMKKRGTVLVDGRGQSEWDQSHLPGALPLPLGDFEKNYPIYEKKLKHAKIIISYCHGKGCHLSDSLAQDLVNKGYKNVAVFWGGFPEWSGAKLPLVDKNGNAVPTAK
jgi:rhodanese-related sulfurtransferase